MHPLSSSYLYKKYIIKNKIQVILYEADAQNQKATITTRVRRSHRDSSDTDENQRHIWEPTHTWQELRRMGRSEAGAQIYISEEDMLDMYLF